MSSSSSISNSSSNNNNNNDNNKSNNNNSSSSDDQKKSNASKEDNDNLLRKWTPLNKLFDPVLMRLEEEAHQTRMDVHRLREHGRQLRLNRLQALDALETKRVTLTEVLRRMEKELNDRDVYEYGDVLAEVFGTRKIFAHRAIGLESLLCQFMHQMLAKQHQLKIMKKAAKDIQDDMKRHKMRHRDKYYSYEAFCVQLETSRLSLEVMYDDIFASQHRLLAELKHVEAGGQPTQPSPRNKTTGSNSNSKASPNAKQKAQPLTPTSSRQTQVEKVSPASIDSAHSSIPSDFDSAMEVLSTANSPSEAAFHDEKKDTHESPTLQERKSSRRPKKKSPGKPMDNAPLAPSSPSKNGSGHRASGSKSARERRRQIEQQRLGRIIPGSKGNTSHNHEVDDGMVPARVRMRELEQLAAKTKNKDQLKKLEDVDLQVKSVSAQS